MLFVFLYQVLRRCSSYMTPDATTLRQLACPREVYVTQTASIEEDPYVAINNAILRKVCFAIVLSNLTVDLTAVIRLLTLHLSVWLRCTALQKAHETLLGAI